ncbi:MAG: FecR domain-containing protein, partial [Bacteroidota bacterium]|nr:FecR domain-containing protein [Bacteroidota bacterium]
PTTYAGKDIPSGTIDLVDGSKIILDKNASVVVDPFSKKIRKVNLNGKAYFEVAPDQTKPFIVESGSTLTEVVGTAFTINASDQLTKIFVTNGKVIFKSLAKGVDAIALTAGEAAQYKDGKIERIVNPSPNYNAWQTNQLSFVNMPLSDVITDVADYFKREIVIENEGSKYCRISIARFKEPQFESVLKAIALSIDAEFVLEGNKCIIRGGRNCQ